MRAHALAALALGLLALPAAAQAPDRDMMAGILGGIFDGQFAGGAAEARDAFIDCAIEAFAGLSDEDLAYVVEEEFDPPSDRRRALEAAYPGLSEAANACGEAADAAAGP